MADHVPHGVESCEMRRFGFPLLYTVFAEVAHSSVEEFVNSVRGVRFGNGDERDFFTATARALGRSRHLLAHAGYGLSQVTGEGTHRANSNTPCNFTLHSRKVMQFERRRGAFPTLPFVPFCLKCCCFLAALP